LALSTLLALSKIHQRKQGAYSVKNKLFKSALIVASVAAVSPAVAGDWYFAGSAGQSDFKAEKGDIDGALIAAGATGLSSSLDDQDTAYKLQAGYRFNQNFALEGGYINLGKLKYSAAYTGGAGRAEIKADGWNIDVVGSIPVGQTFVLFGKVGMINAKVEATVSATGPGGAAAGSVDDTSSKGHWGIGGDYALNDKMAVRLEYERFKNLGDENTTGEGDVDLLSVGFVLKF